MRKFAQVFHVGAIIELIENDDLMNEQEEEEEEEEEVKFNKLSVVFHPKKEREKERKREKETHIIIAVKNLIDPVCLKTNDAKETTEERCRPQKKIINTAQTTTTSTTTTTKKKKKIASLLTLQCGYFFAKRMATWEAIKPAPPVINTFFGSYGISHSLFFMTMFLPSLKRMDLSFKFAVD